MQILMTQFDDILSTERLEQWEELQQVQSKLLSWQLLIAQQVL